MDYEKIIEFMERKLIIEQRIERLPDYNGWEVYAPLRGAVWYNWLPEFTLIKGEEIRDAKLDEAAEIVENLPPEYTEEPEPEIDSEEREEESEEEKLEEELESDLLSGEYE